MTSFFSLWRLLLLDGWLIILLNSTLPCYLFILFHLDAGIDFINTASFKYFCLSLSISLPYILGILLNRSRHPHKQQNLIREKKIFFTLDLVCSYINYSLLFLSYCYQWRLKNYFTHQIKKKQ